MTEPEGSHGPDTIERLRAAILDIDAHATPYGEDSDGFVSGGYFITVGSLHRALGVVGHSTAKCHYCALLQADGKPGCDELRYEVSNEWNRDALESIATALGVPVEVDYGPKANGILLDDILTAITERDS